MKTQQIWLIAALASVFLSFGTRAEYHDYFEPDHYLSYDILTISLHKHHISLQDQFIDWTDFTVRKPIKLLNPVAKRHNGQVHGIKDPKLHYTAYELNYPNDISIDEKVLVINQFGEFILEKFRPDRLLTPTYKRELTMLNENDAFDPMHHSDAYDHYLCYEIPPITIETGAGFLKDQFRSRPFDKLVAKRFCNPAAKKHKDKVYDIAHDDPTNHLMCFEIDSLRIFRVVALLNQFGVKKAIVTKDDELCVPSFKTKLADECMGSKPGDDGMCNGICPNPADTCLPDPAGQRCDCFSQPIPCTEDTWSDDGVCNGYCPDPTQACLPDFTTEGCYCAPQEPQNCFDTIPGDDGTCNGLCPAGEICVSNPDQKCECRPEHTPCGFNADGSCGGLCPIDAPFCDIIPGTNECGCFN